MSFVSRFTLRLLTLSSLMVSQGPQHFWFFVEVQVDCDTCFSGLSAGFYFLFPFFFLFLWLSETVAHRSLRLFRTEQYVRFVSMFVHISGTITLLSSRAHTNSAHINETRRTDWGSSACRQDRDCFAELRPTKVRLHPRVWKIYRNGFFSVFFLFTRVRLNLPIRWARVHRKEMILNWRIKLAVERVVCLSSTRAGWLFVICHSTFVDKWFI